MNLLHVIYLTSLIVSSGIGIYRYRVLDIAARILCLLIAFVFLSELAALYSALRYKNNLSIYNISVVLQSVFICFYFNYSIDILSERKIGLWLGFVSLLAGTAKLLFYRADDLNTAFIVYLGILSIGMSALSCLRLLTAENKIRLYAQPHFWFVVIMTLSWSTTLLNWTIFNRYNDQFAAYADYATLMIIIVNIVYYAAIATVFLLYPNMINKK